MLIHHLSKQIRFTILYHLANVLMSSVFFLCPAAGSAQVTNADTSSAIVTLESIWQMVGVHNKSVILEDLNVDIGLEKIKDARISMLPEININGELDGYTNLPEYEHGLFHTPAQYPIPKTFYSLGTNIYFNIYNGSRTKINQAYQKASLVKEQEQTKLTLAEAKLLAAAFYLDLRRAVIFKQLLLNDIEEQRKQLLRIQTLKKNGVVLKSDVLRAELKLSGQGLELVQVENDILIATQKLNILTGSPDERVILPVELFDPDTIILKPYQNYIADALNRSFEINIAGNEIEMKQLGLKRVKSNQLPSIGFYANYAYSYPQGEFYPYSLSLFGLGSAGIKASFPISSFYLNKHKIKIAEIELKSAMLYGQDTQDKFRENVNTAYLRFKEYVVRLGIAKANIVLATENQRVLRNSYFNQISLITDLLDADTQLLKSRFEYVSAKTAAQLQYFQLQKILGNL
jgi:outer membrane protein